MKQLLIVAGHGKGSNGRDDNGAQGNGTDERKEVVEVVVELVERLRQDKDMVPAKTIGVEKRLTLKEKIAEINKEDPESLVIEVHMNSSSNVDARGVEAFYNPREKTRGIATTLVEHVAKATGLPLRKYPLVESDRNRHGRLAIVDDTKPKALLIELGFLTNEFDANVIKDVNLDDNFAAGLHNGIRDILGLPMTTDFPEFYRDVPEDSWYFEDVKECLENGIFDMAKDGRFRPSHTVNRAELAAVCARLLRHIPK